MENKNNSTNEKSFLKALGTGFKTFGHWMKRAFLGASKTENEDDPFAVEKLESPSKMAFKAFFRKKLQVTALIILIALFLFVFIGPLFVDMDVTSETTQANMAPNMSLRSVPSKLKKQIKSISSFSTFTVGVSKEDELFVWGYSKDTITKVDFADYPEELEGKGKVVYAAAGYDHCVAITNEGKVVCWGSNTLAQYGQYEGITEEEIASGAKVIEPQSIIDNGVDVNNIAQLNCGYQATIIVYKDGNFDCWGNGYSTKNLASLLEWKSDLALEGKTPNVVKAVFSNSYLFLLCSDGTVKSSAGNKCYLSTDKLRSYNVVDIAADANCVGAVTSDGKIITTGVFEYNENVVPEIAEGDKFVSITAGTRHFAATTANGKSYTWGSDFYKQTKITDYDGADEVIATSNQTYFLKDGKLVKSAGLKGFIMGTDSFGRDLFARIVHGGKMTMTIGAVAVIISTIIAILVGCISGYFGGWVDMLLMRVTEIFSSLPFLPFAMMLSVVISNFNISENMRIFIIMIILGLLSWTGLAKMIRGQVLAEREKEFVIAAKAMGVKEGRIAFKHILPNIVSVILVSVTLDFAGCMLTESSLSYLGFGVQQPQPTWGNLLNGCNNSIVIKFYWWQWFFPAIFLAVATICVNIIGDGLRDVLDPKSSSER